MVLENSSFTKKEEQMVHMRFQCQEEFVICLITESNCNLFLFSGSALRVFRSKEQKQLFRVG